MITLGMNLKGKRQTSCYKHVLTCAFVEIVGSFNVKETQCISLTHRVQKVLDPWHYCFRLPVPTHKLQHKSNTNCNHQIIFPPILYTSI